MATVGFNLFLPLGCWGNKKHCKEPCAVLVWELLANAGLQHGVVGQN